LVREFSEHRERQPEKKKIKGKELYHSRSNKHMSSKAGEEWRDAAHKYVTSIASRAMCQTAKKTTKKRRDIEKKKKNR
jgi:histone H3/H4